MTLASGKGYFLRARPARYRVDVTSLEAMLLRDEWETRYRNRNADLERMHDDGGARYDDASADRARQAARMQEIEAELGALSVPIIEIVDSTRPR